MGSINIKIRNHYGINKLEGKDLTSEETIALLELAKHVVNPSMLLEAAPINIGLPTAEPFYVDTYEPKTTVEADVEIDTPETEDETPSTPDVVEDKKSTGVSTMAAAMTTAFAGKFSVASTTLAEDSSMLTLEEQVEVLNRDFHDTGVKHKIYHGEITPFYRVRWECPKCGDKGNHYAPENVKQMFCYNCNAALLVRPANGRFPNRDDWGNFFLADELNMKFMRA